MELREASAGYLVMVGQRVPVGYKQTEVGVIPVDWVVLSAFDACYKIQDGTHFSPRIRGNDYFYVTSKNIRFGYLDMSTASRIDAAQHQAIYRRCDVKKGDLLLTKDGANTGNAALNILDEEFSLLSSVAFLRFHQSKHCAAFFLQQILTSQGQRQIQEAMAGNAITRLTLKKINKLRFPVPPTKAEQESIAEVLSDADALIESLEQLLAKKRYLKQGAMQQLLTGKKRLPGFSGEWEVKRLGSVLRFQVGFPFSSAYFNEAGQGIRLVKNRDLKSDDSVFHYSGKYEEGFLVRDGDVLIGMDGDFLPCLWAKGAALLNQRVGRIVPLAGLDRVFAFYHLIEPLKEIESATSSTTVKHLSHGDIEDIEKPLPVVQEQIAIAAILSDMDTELATLESKLTKARSLKQGMMQELLTGRIRLV